MSNKGNNKIVNTALVGANNIVVDVRGSLCPTPVIETKKLWKAILALYLRLL